MHACMARFVFAKDQLCFTYWACKQIQVTVTVKLNIDGENQAATSQYVSRNLMVWLESVDLGRTRATLTKSTSMTFAGRCGESCETSSCWG